MARKNVLSNLMAPANDKLTPVNPAADEQRQHVTYKGIGALGAVTRSIDALAGKGGAVEKTPFKSPIADYYLTNPIARASAVMAECSRLASGKILSAAE